jgi:hypothetical protein
MPLKIEFLIVMIISRESSGVMTMGYGLDSRGSIPSRVNQFFFSFTASRPAVEPTEPPTQWVAGHLSSGVMQRGCEAVYLVHLVPRSRMVELYLLSTHTPLWLGAYLFKPRDNFTFTSLPLWLLWKFLYSVMCMLNGYRRFGEMCCLHACERINPGHFTTDSSSIKILNSRSLDR